jgi:CCR4-NOT transcription complex subunit 2
MNPQWSNIAGGQYRKQTTEFTGDDFPALGAPSASSSNPTREEILMSNLLGNATQSANIGASIMTPGNLEFGGPSKPPGVGFVGGPQFKRHEPKSPALKSDKGEDTKEKFGLLGLVDVVRMTNQDVTMLALGCDLTSLGLDLNSTDNIYSNFMSPFADNPTTGAEPSFSISTSYAFSKPVPECLSKISKLTDETLFYIFYSMPRDILQEAAAQELYVRRWRFHKEFKLWLTKEDLNSEPIMKGPDFERGIYVFFDPSSWTKVKKEWILYFDQLEERNCDPNSAMSWINSQGSIFASTESEIQGVAQKVQKLGIYEKKTDSAKRK